MSSTAIHAMHASSTSMLMGFSKISSTIPLLLVIILTEKKKKKNCFFSFIFMILVWLVCRFESDERWMLRRGAEQRADNVSADANAVPEQRSVLVLGCISSLRSCKYCGWKKIIQSWEGYWFLSLWYQPFGSTLKSHFKKNESNVIAETIELMIYDICWQFVIPYKN